ncbi:MAG: glycine oxidase ThiO [Rhodospirillaceae bacterium]|jgi:glycine oxidase|nr:glycine oxidase ThiO [Rhodospirillaceae bacterium]MBT5458380.1 glycine oxidase ThiO [Rhodospirillaceae bacterium]MBT7758756.1 glycine oxidase ThiO [Rhodospirillaceae bacterium]
MIVIVGGGICGLGIGWRLAQAGQDVCVIDRGEANKAATWAAAGMLAPQAEAEHAEEALLPLALESRAMWVDFAGDLLTATGIDVDYRAEGTLVVALDRDDREYLEHRYSYFRELGLGVEWLSGYEARQKEPFLARAVTGAIFSPLDHQVDNRRVGDALKDAYLQAGGTLREHTEIDEILLQGDHVTGVRIGAEEIAAEAVVVAAGAWSRNIPGLPEHVRPPVRPLKGQMVAVQMPSDAPLIQHVVWGPGNSIVPSIYLAPKGDGRLIIGATVEEMGFDTELTAGGLFELLRSAWEALPGIYDLPVVESWAGLRPASRDDAPILGPTAIDGLVMATGHHRNGILLAPITARAVSDYLLTGRVASIIQPFLLERFAPASVPSDRIGAVVEPLREAT